MTARASVAALEAKWRHHTVDIDGGHLAWTGPEKIAWRGRELRPAHAAYIIRTGHEPEGRSRADCGHRGCIQPAHVEDAAGRARIREQFRTLTGIRARAATCRQGHDQTDHGRLTPGGISYCQTCITTSRRTTREEVTA
jgi:hypothetical protein